ncbi:unnamed protein product [Boreogadus saida]
MASGPVEVDWTASHLSVGDGWRLETLMFRGSGGFGCSHEGCTGWVSVTCGLDRMGLTGGSTVLILELELDDNIPPRWMSTTQTPGTLL